MFAVTTATAERNLNRSPDLSQSSDSFTSISGLTFRQPIQSAANPTVFSFKMHHPFSPFLHSLQLHNPNPSTPSLGPSALPTVEKDSPGKHSPCSFLAPPRLIMTVPKVYGHGSWILEFEAALAPCFLPLCWDSVSLQGGLLPCSSPWVLATLPTFHHTCANSNRTWFSTSNQPPLVSKLWLFIVVNSHMPAMRITHWLRSRTQIF